MTFRTRSDRLPRRARRDRPQLLLPRGRRTASSSSTAGSCSPTPTCPASTSSCPTSRTCARTPTGSRACCSRTRTRTTRAGSRSCCATSRCRSTAPQLSLALARNRIEEAGMLDRTELIPVHDGERRTDRPVRLPVHPGDALGAARLRDRVLHARGHDRAHRRLQARPHAGRRPPHRPRAARRARRGATAACACCSPTRRTRSGPASRRRSRRSAPRCARCSASTRPSGSSSRASRRTSIACSRSRRPRSRTAARIAFVGRSMEQNVTMARELGFLDIPAYAVIDIEETRALRAGRGVHHLHRFAGRADERAVADGRARAQAREGLRPTTSS